MQMRGTEAYIYEQWRVLLSGKLEESQREVGRFKQLERPFGIVCKAAAEAHLKNKTRIYIPADDTVAFHVVAQQGDKIKVFRDLANKLEEELTEAGLQPDTGTYGEGNWLPVIFFTWKLRHEPPQFVSLEIELPQDGISDISIRRKDIAAHYTNYEIIYGGNVRVLRG
jgi:hypothetical protein